MALTQDQEAQANRKVLEDARGTISAAIAFLQQSNAVTSATGESATSFQAALQDAIFEIDSQPDLVDPYLDPTIGDSVSTADVGKAFTFGSLQVPRRQGKLQRLRSLKVALFGGEGLFLATLTGPGEVVLQTLPFSRLADRIMSAASFSSRGEKRGVGGLLGDLISGD